MALFIDLDGVLADFDVHYRDKVGALPPSWSQGHDHAAAGTDVDWQRLAEIDFYRDVPKMLDADDLWTYVRHYEPTIITGLPTTGRDKAENSKRYWVMEHYGPLVHVVTCLSREKCKYMTPGDVLVDDWEKYKHLWIQKGGIWITHTSAASTIEKLREIGL